MDSKNASNFVVDDNFDGPNCSRISSFGMDIGEIIEKMQKLEVSE